MKAQVITTEYTDAFPVQPWQRVVRTASQDAAIEAVESGVQPPAAVAAAPGKACDRGASAVEWVVITGIVVAIVAGVGWGISKAIGNKADDACNKINGAGNVSVTGGNSGGNAGTSGTTGGTGGSGCK